MRESQMRGNSQPIIAMPSSGFGGGGGGADAFSSGILPPADLKGPPLCTIWRYPFLADWPEKLSKGTFGANLC